MPVTRDNNLGDEKTKINELNNQYIATKGTYDNRPFYSCVLSYLAMNASEAGVELALIQTSLLFSCKCELINIRTA